MDRVQLETPVSITFKSILIGRISSQCAINLSEANKFYSDSEHLPPPPNRHIYTGPSLQSYFIRTLKMSGIISNITA